MRQNTENVSPMSNEGRNRYVVEHITAALLELMQSRAFADISISLLCSEAGVGRASFYRNFESKEDVVRKHLIRLLQEWGREFESKGDPSLFSDTLLRHFYKYKDFYLLLYRHGMAEMIYESIRWASKLDEAQTHMERYARSMVAGMVFGWADEWMRQGMPETPEELALLTAQDKARHDGQSGAL